MRPLVERSSSSSSMACSPSAFPKNLIMIPPEHSHCKTHSAERRQSSSATSTERWSRQCGTSGTASTAVTREAASSHHSCSIASQHLWMMVLLPRNNRRLRKIRSYHLSHHIDIKHSHTGTSSSSRSGNTNTNTNAHRHNLVRQVSSPCLEPKNQSTPVTPATTTSTETIDPIPIRISTDMSHHSRSHRFHSPRDGSGSDAAAVAAVAASHVDCTNHNTRTALSHEALLHTPVLNNCPNSSTNSLHRFLSPSSTNNAYTGTGTASPRPGIDSTVPSEIVIHLPNRRRDCHRHSPTRIHVESGVAVVARRHHVGATELLSDSTDAYIGDGDDSENHVDDDNDDDLELRSEASSDLDQLLTQLDLAVDRTDGTDDDNRNDSARRHCLSPHHSLAAPLPSPLSLSGCPCVQPPNEHGNEIELLSCWNKFPSSGTPNTAMVATGTVTTHDSVWGITTTTLDDMMESPSPRRPRTRTGSSSNPTMLLHSYTRKLSRPRSSSQTTDRVVWPSDEEGSPQKQMQTMFMHHSLLRCGGDQACGTTSTTETETASALRNDQDKCTTETMSSDS